MDEDLTMLIGPARDGPVILHALPLRAKFYRFLG
jgi:hypothetical protein